MKVTLANGNHFQVRNGKLVVKQTPSESSLNYRYIPYTPINKPTQQDYFRATIDELLKENAQLKQLLKQNTQFIGSKVHLHHNRQQTDELNHYKTKYTEVCQQLQIQRKRIMEKTHEASDLNNTNYELHRKIDELGRQLYFLKNKIKNSETESMKINRVLQSFSGAIQKVSQLQSALSENPELSEKLSQSPSRKNHRNIVKYVQSVDQYDDRYMTPKQKIYDLQPTNHKNKSAEQQSYRPKTQGPIKETVDSWKVDNSGRLGSQNSEDKYESPHKIWKTGNQDCMDDVDPISGSLYAMFTRNKK